MLTRVFSKSSDTFRKNLFRSDQNKKQVKKDSVTFNCGLWIYMGKSMSYLHRSVESWVPKVYSVEAILLISSAAPETHVQLDL